MRQHIRSSGHGPTGGCFGGGLPPPGQGLLATIALLAGGSIAEAKPASPVLSFTPSAHDYGRVAVGEKVTQTFTLVNTGRKTTHRLRIVLKGDEAFAVTRDSCSRTRLRPGRSCKVTARFKPDSAATVTATLQATAGKHRRVQARAALTGAGSELGAPEEAGQIYWANARAGTINRAIPGVPAVDTVVTGQNNPQGVAVSISHVYWTSAAAGGQIWRADSGRHRREGDRSWAERPVRARARQQLPVLVQQW